MAEEATPKNNPLSADWLVQGVLTRIGDAFDRFTGRGWKPSSSLATSELAERLKSLVDAEAREGEDKRKYVPHNIALKMQWDKFSTDSETALRKLENELLTALVDHINDRRYYTYAPLSLAVKPDYFTSGVKLSASFEKAADDEREISVDVTVPDMNADIPESARTSPAAAQARIRFRYEIAGRERELFVDLKAGGRVSVGRTRENDLALDDASVSKMHASLLLNNAGELVVADTGSTNGTFIDGERIAYGKAVPFRPEQKLRFGTVNVDLEIIAQDVPSENEASDRETPPATEESVRIGEFEFSQKLPTPEPEGGEPAPTMPSIPVGESQLLKPLVQDALSQKEETSGNT